MRVYIADTNPTNALSVLRLSHIIPEANGLRLEWQGGERAWQFLERTNTLTSTANRWITIFTNPPPTLLSTNFLDDILGTNRPLFYRVRAVRE